MLMIPKKLASSMLYRKIRYPFNYSRPSEIILDVTGHCNAKCPFCARQFMPKKRQAGMMDFELYQSIIADAKRNNIKILRMYSTGEPLLHPEIDKMITLANKSGMLISLSTNASLLHLHFNVLAKLETLQFSIEGWDKESYEANRYPLKFDRVYENIKNYSDYRKGNFSNKPHVRINLLLTDNTEIEKIIALWGEYVDEIRVNSMLPTTRYIAGKFQSDINQFANVKWVDYKKRWCAYPFHSLTIGYDGKIGLCCADFAYELDLGYVQDGIKKAINTEQIQKIRSQFISNKLATCAECNQFIEPVETQIREIRSRIIKHLNHNKVRCVIKVGAMGEQISGQ